MFDAIDTIYEKTTVVVVDDFNCVRKGIVSLLSKSGSVSVLGDAETVEEAIPMVCKTKPNVLLVDTYLPTKQDGLDLTREINRRVPETQILVLSGSRKVRDIEEMLQAGASGYVLKTNGITEVLKGVFVLANGGTYLCAEAANLLNEVKERNPFSLLTQREREIFSAFVYGLDTGKIAAEYHISLDTVATHRRNIYSKTGLNSIPELIWFAIRHDIVDVSLGARESRIS